MRYTLSLSSIFLAIVILLSSFQCSRWAKYARDISIEINTDKLLVVNDSVNVLAHASMGQNLVLKIDSIRIYFYYLSQDNYFENSEAEIGSILLTPNNRSQSKQIDFKFIKGKSLYAKHIISKNDKRIESRLFLVAEQ